MAETLSDALLVVFGWLLGTFSPVIGRAIERRQRRKELLRGLTYECKELRFTIANLLFSSRRLALALDKATIDLVKPILTEYSGPHDQELVSGMRRMFAVDDAVLIAASNDERGQKKDPFGRPVVSWPVTYSLPFLSAHLGELDLLPAEAQERLHRIDAELKLFNNQVEYIRHLLDRSFTLSGPNHALNAQSIETAQTNFAVRCEVLVKVINGLLALPTVRTLASDSLSGSVSS